MTEGVTLMSDKITNAIQALGAAHAEALDAAQAEVDDLETRLEAAEKRKAKIVEERFRLVFLTGSRLACRKLDKLDAEATAVEWEIENLATKSLDASTWLAWLRAQRPRRRSRAR